MNDQLDLARRAVACKHWKWMPGMVDVRHGRILDIASVEGENLPRVLIRDRSTAYMSGTVKMMWYHATSSWLPDLSDPATIGCLLALVREAWNMPYLSALTDRENGWTVCWQTGPRIGLLTYPPCDTEAAALVAALEAAP